MMKKQEIWLTFTFVNLIILACLGLSQKLECTGGKVDVTFVLDYSSSVGEEDFTNFLIPAVVSMVNGFDSISADTVRVAVVGFSTQAYLEFKFDDYLTKERVISAVRSLKYKDGSTATGEALYMVQRDLVPLVREDVKHMVIVLTDGDMNLGRPLEPEVKALRQSGAEIFAVGVGEYLNPKELLKISGTDDHTILLKNYQQLFQRAKEISKLTCKKIEEMPDPSVINRGKCRGSKTELTFVLDASGSVHEDIFETHVKSAVKTIVESLNVKPKADRVALVLYATRTVLMFNLDTYKSEEEVFRAIKNLPYIKGATATGDALAMVTNKVVPKVRPGVPHVVLVITDGHANMGQPVAQAAGALKATGATIVSVGVGSSIGKRSLLEMASSPEYVISVKNYAELVDKAVGIAATACDTTSTEEISVSKKPQPRADESTIIEKRFVKRTTIRKIEKPDEVPDFFE